MNGLSTSNNGNGHHPRPIITEYRCRSCGRRLFDAYLPAGARLRIRCPRCGKMVLFGFPPEAPAPPEPIKADSLLQSA